MQLTMNNFIAAMGKWSLEFVHLGVSSVEFYAVGVSLEFVQLGVYFFELCPIGSIFFGVLSS